MVQGKSLLEALGGLAARREHRPSIVGKDVDALRCARRISSANTRTLDISAKSATYPSTRPPSPTAVASRTTDLTR